VGFIRKLPHHLIASFKSTLTEVVEADILLHVVDVTSEVFEEQIEVVNSTLEELHANDKPTIMIFNKIDRLGDRSFLKELEGRYEHALSISAARGINISKLKEMIQTLVEGELVERTMTFKQSEYKIISFLHDVAHVLEKTYLDNRVRIRFRIKGPQLQKVQALMRKAGVPAGS